MLTSNWRSTFLKSHNYWEESAVWTVPSWLQILYISHCYSVSFISFSFRSYVRCSSLVMRICMINTSPLLISPLKWWMFLKVSTSVNVCILDFCSFNVTATESFWCKHTEYVQHQKKYFKTITLPFGGVELWNGANTLKP